MTTGGDPSLVGTSEEDCLRRFVTARNAGDDPGATEWWSELVEVSFDRIAGLVDLWSYRKARLDAEERDEAIQRVIVSMWERVRWTFEGRSMGELHNTLEQLVHFRCADVVDEQVKHRDRHPTSLDRTWVGEDGSERDARPGEVAEAVANYERDAAQEEAADALDRALAGMRDERERAVLRHTLAGTPAKQIAAEVQVTVTNVYKIRERALKSAYAILKEQDA